MCAQSILHSVSGQLQAKGGTTAADVQSTRDALPTLVLFRFLTSDSLAKDHCRQQVQHEAQLMIDGDCITNACANSLARLLPSRFFGKEFLSLPILPLSLKFLPLIFPRKLTMYAHIKWRY